MTLHCSLTFRFREHLSYRRSDDTYLHPVCQIRTYSLVKRGALEQQERLRKIFDYLYPYFLREW